MRIGEVSAPSYPSGDSLEQWVAIIFQESLGVVRSLLRNEYELLEEDAVVLEGDLFTWLMRFCRRPDSDCKLTAREALLVMACMYARSLQTSRAASGALRPEGRLKMVLEMEPFELARQASRPRRFLYLSLHTA